jgi:PIN domain nuclease of toxin-antitoxin system
LGAVTVTVTTGPGPQTSVELRTFDRPSIYYLEVLPWLHRDPFDRLLIAQAVTSNYLLVTPDPLIRSYSVKTIW